MSGLENKMGDFKLGSGASDSRASNEAFDRELKRQFDSVFGSSFQVPKTKEELDRASERESSIQEQVMEEENNKITELGYQQAFLLMQMSLLVIDGMSPNTSEASIVMRKNKREGTGPLPGETPDRVKLHQLDCMYVSIKNRLRILEIRSRKREEAVLRARAIRHSSMHRGAGLGLKYRRKIVQSTATARFGRRRATELGFRDDDGDARQLDKILGALPKQVQQQELDDEDSHVSMDEDYDECQEDPQEQS